MPLPTGMSLQCGGANALGKTGLGGGGAGRVAGRGSGVGRVYCKGARKVMAGVPALEGSAGRVRWKGFQRWKGGSSRVSAPKGVPAGVPAGIVSPVSPAFRPLSGYSGCLAAIGTAGGVGGRAVGSRRQCSICGGQHIGRMAGPLGGDLANECNSEAWGRGRAHVPVWSNALVQVLELNVATASGMKVVCTFPVRVKGLQSKKRAEYMFGFGKALHRSWSYEMYHEEDGRSVWYGLRGLQCVRGDEVPESVMKVFAAWVNERKESYAGGRGHTRGVAIEVEGDDADAEDKEQRTDKDKDKGKDKAKDEPKEKGKDKGHRKNRDMDKDKDKDKTTRASHSSESQSQKSRQMVDARAMADEVVQRCKDSVT